MPGRHRHDTLGDDTNADHPTTEMTREMRRGWRWQRHLSLGDGVVSVWSILGALAVGTGLAAVVSVVQLFATHPDAPTLPPAHPMRSAPIPRVVLPSHPVPDIHHT
jgi:hypothetical protein